MDLSSQDPIEDPDDPLDAGLRRGFGARCARPGSSGRGGVTDADASTIGEAEDAGLADHARYEVLSEVGRGGMGVVLRARDHVLRRDVAIKVMRADRAHGERAAARLRAEAQIAGQLQHPAIVPVHDVDVTATGRPYVVMRLVDGETLLDRLDVRPDPREGRRAFVTAFERISQAVAYAHSRGVIHRDLKPSNVMLGSFGEVHVMDWGLAKALGGTSSVSAEVTTSRDDDDAQSSLSGSVVGTPAYMPPEQARGEGERVDCRADVFALGAILCEILTGVPPYGPRGSTGLREAAAGDLDAARARLGAVVDDGLSDLALRCLNPDPEQRPSDAGVVVNAVATWLGDEERRAREAQGSAAEASAEARHERRLRRRTRAAAVVVVLAVVGVAAILWWQQSSRREQERDTGLAVVEAMTNARRLERAARSATDAEMALAAWDAAVAAGGRAQLALQTGRSSEDLDVRTRTEVDAMVAARDDAARVAADGRRERAMTERLRELQVLDRLRLGPAEVMQAYVEAYRGFGIDPWADDAAALISASPISDALVTGLSTWWLSLGGSRDDTAKQGLGSLIATVDGDRQRSMIRGVGAKGDTARLEGLAADPQLLDGPAHTVVMAANSLGSLVGPPASIALLERALMRQPGAFRIAYELGDWRLRCGPPRLEQAVHAFEVALGCRPENVLVRIRLAETCARLGQVAAARTWLKEAERRGAPRARLLFVEGMVLERTSDPEAVVANHKAILKLDPEFAAAWRAEGARLLATGNREAALACFEKAAALRPDSALVLVSLANALGGGGKSERELDLFQRAVRAEPSSFRGWQGLSVVFRARDRIDDSLSAAERAVKIAPQDGGCRFSLGNCLRKKGRFEAALREMREALRLGVHARLRDVVNARVEVCGQEAAVARLIAGIVAGNDPGPPRRSDWDPLFKVLDELKLRARAAALWERALETGIPTTGDFLRAARAAVDAATGHGHDADTTDSDARRQLLRRARLWLEAAVNAAPGHPSATRRLVRRLGDPAFDRLRQPPSEGQSETERRAWMALWARVDALDG